MSDGGSASQVLQRRAPAAILGLLAVAAYATIAVFTLFNGQTFTQEVASLVRSWWYVTGTIAPYSAADMSRDMPLYFYELGFWQLLVGPGHLAGRLPSILLGAASGVLLFSICRRLTANSVVAAAAAFIFLATPATSFFFATATSAATASALHLLAIWLIVDSMGKPRAHISVLLGLVCAALYFTRQEMFLSVIVLVPLYIAAVGRDRALQALILLGTAAIATGLVIVVFPAAFLPVALNLPLFGGMLGDAGLLGPDYALIARGTHGPGGLDAAFDAANLKGLLETFALPNAGTLLLALALFFVASGPLKVLWIAPLYFLWIALGTYATFSAAASCETCMQPATPAFIGAGALAAALTLALHGLKAKQRGSSPGALVVIGALAAVALNTLAPLAASHPAAKAFPRPMLDRLTAAPELAELPVLTRWTASQLKTKEPVLVIHGLGRSDAAALPYAVIAAGHAMPAESLDLKSTARTINQSLVGEMRESVRTAVEDAGLWNDEIMRRWIEKDYNTILLQDDPSPAVAALKKQIEAAFDPTGVTRYRGYSILMFTRKPAQ